MLSPKTVSVYRARVLEKLQLTNNAELTVYAYAISWSDRHWIEDKHLGSKAQIVLSITTVGLQKYHGLHPSA